MMQKIKAWVESDKGKDILTIIIIILVGLCAFGLGRLSKMGDSRGLEIHYDGKLIETTNQAGNAVFGANEAYQGLLVKSNNPKITGKSFFASSRGSKYYPSDCTAGKNIKIANRVYFDTREEAERAGYELSSSCR